MEGRELLGKRRKETGECARKGNGIMYKGKKEETVSGKRKGEMRRGGKKGGRLGPLLRGQNGS